MNPRAAADLGGSADLPRFLAACFATMLPPLGDLFGVCSGIGAVIGGVIGLAIKSTTLRQLAENVALGGGVGGVCGAAVALAIWLGGTAAGG